MSFTSEPRWHRHKRGPASPANGPLRSWLLDRGSLTERLIKLSHGDFGVEVIRQQMAFPRPSERKVLSMRHGGRPWVYARSVIPQTSLNGRLRGLRKLDNRPLGALLFSDPHMRRGAIELACQDTRQLPLPGPLQGIQATIPGRRSLFWLDNKPLLVCEMFLPEFTPYNTPL